MLIIEARFPLPPKSARGSGRRTRRIFGQLDHDGHDVKVTLLDCIWLSPTKYHANRLLIGGHLAVDDTTFAQAIIRLRDLPAWVAQEALTVEVDTALEETARRELRVHLDRPPAMRAPFARGELSLDFRWSRKDVDYEQLTIRQWPQFELARLGASRRAHGNDPLRHEGRADERQEDERAETMLRLRSG